MIGPTGDIFDDCLVEKDAAAVPAVVFCVVESLVGSGEKRAGDFAGGGLGETDADGERKTGARDREFAYRLLDARGDELGF